MRAARSLILAVLLVPAVASADEIYLKGGGRLSGQIVSRTATSVEVDVGAGRVTVPADRVERIQEGRSALMEYQDRARALKPGDAAGWKALGEWASGRGLNSQAREAYEKALALAPADADVNAALGRAQVNGRWMDEDEAYRARGFVQYEGQWMTPAEQSAIVSDRAAMEAESRARAAEGRAQQADAEAADAREKQAQAEADAAAAQDDGIPLWYGWAAGPNVWPSTVVVPARPAQMPAVKRR